jgi:dihydrofolate reductase
MCAERPECAHEQRPEGRLRAAVILVYDRRMPGRVRVFIAASLDGFIAGPDDDLSWLPPPEEDDHGYAAFMADVGALLMGRRTHDVVAGFTGAWPYGERPVLVATRRPLTPRAPTVRAVSGTIAAMVAEARAAADGRDVYLDGGDLIRQTLDAGLVDELIVSIIPVVLGAGHPLFAGVGRPHRLELVHTAAKPTLVQLTYRPRAAAQS